MRLMSRLSAWSAVIGAVFAGFSATVLMLVFATSATATNNSTALGYVLLYGGGALCVLLAVLIVGRVVPAVLRGELGPLTVAANLFIEACLWAVCVGGALALGAD